MRRYSLPRPVNVGAATCGAAAAVAGGSNAAGGGGSVSGNKSSSFDISLHTNAPVEAGSGLAAAAADTPVAVAPERGGRTMLVLRGGTLIDGTGRTPVRDATVVITDGRIETVTTGAAATWPSSAEVIDVAGMTVLPGLIDCHDHLAFHGYELASRLELNEPGSTRHVRTARVIERTLAMATRQSVMPA